MAGDRIGSAYRLVERIGRGGMGDVWSAEGPKGRVAIKVLRSDLADDDLVVARFLQERSILVALRSPYVVEVFDLVAEGSRLAIVMELVDGVDLRAVLQREASLRPPRAVAIARNVLAGLAAAHAIGVVHRDVKPENILLGGTHDLELVKIADFGVARIAASAGATQRTGLVGTPRYLAPELARGDRPTSAADVYGAGIVLYEMLFGRPPFDGESPYAVIRAHTEDPLFRPDGVPDALWSAIDAMTDKEPAARPSALDANRILAEIPAALVPSERMAHLGYLAPDEPTTHAGAGDALGQGTLALPEPPARGRPARCRSKSRRSLIAAGLGAALVVAGLGVAATRMVGHDGADSCVRPRKALLAPVKFPTDRPIVADQAGRPHAGMYFGSTFLGFGNRARNGSDEARAMTAAGAIHPDPDAYELPYTAFRAIDRSPPDGVLFREWAPRDGETKPRWFFTIGGAALPIIEPSALSDTGQGRSRAVVIPRNALDDSRYRTPTDGTVFSAGGTTYVMKDGRRVAATACRGTHPLHVPEERRS